MAASTVGKSSSRAKAAPARPAAKPTQNAGEDASAGPTLTKYVERERRIAEAYRVALETLHLPFGRESLDDCAASHAMRALRIEKTTAPPAPHSQAKPDAPPGSPPAETPASPHAPSLTSTTLLQKAADLFGTPRALTHLRSLERDLLQAYERVDLASLDSKMRQFLESELYAEQVRTHRLIGAVKEAYP